MLTDHRNPVLNADWSDPDVVRVGTDYYMVASSFNRVPGLPLLHSTDLVHWEIIGHALQSLGPSYTRPRHGCGVWAPALRHHDGLFWIFYPDPDHGIHVVTAQDPAGPWSPPWPIKEGRGLIDPCPLWADDGRAYLIHGWAKSRVGFNNRLTLHEMRPDARSLLDAGEVVIDGDLIPGCSILEGPKLYQHDGWYWVFAPAGGVTTGYQMVFRSRDIAGPYEHRITLAQGDSVVNGPHQGGWVDTPDGDHWFLHFQDRGVYGRVVHLQPMTWADGWPVMGADGVPAGPVAYSLTGPPGSDPFTSSEPGLQWTWQAEPDPSWLSLSPGRLELACHRDAAVGDLRRLPNILGQRLPGAPCTATTTVTLTSTTPGARAGLVVLGEAYAWIGIENTETGQDLVYATAVPDAPETVRRFPAESGEIRLTVHAGPGGECRFAVGPHSAGPFTAVAGQWVGATLGLFAAAPAGEGPAGRAAFGPFDVSPPHS